MRCASEVKFGGLTLRLSLEILHRPYGAIDSTSNRLRTILWTGVRPTHWGSLEPSTVDLERASRFRAAGRGSEIAKRLARSLTPKYGHYPHRSWRHGWELRHER